MSNYVITTDFSVKDGLASGNPNKLIKGVDFDTEFVAIRTAIETKSDLASPSFLGTAVFVNAQTSGNLTVSGTTTLAGTLAGTFTIDGGTF